MAKHSHTSQRRRAKNGTESRQWLDSNCKRIGKKVRYFYYSASLFPSLVHSFIRSLACSHKGYTNDSNSISKSGSRDNKTAQKVQSVLTVQVECPSMLARSVDRPVGFLSFPFPSRAQHSTARHGTHNLQIQTNRTLDTIEQTGLEQKQPAKLRTAPKLTLFPSSSLSNALLPLQTCQHLGQLCVLCFLCKSTGPLQKQKYPR